MGREGAMGPCVVNHEEGQQSLEPQRCPVDCLKVWESAYDLPRAPKTR